MKVSETLKNIQAVAAATGGNFKISGPDGDGDYKVEVVYPQNRMLDIEQFGTSLLIATRDWVREYRRKTGVLGFDFDSANKYLRQKAIKGPAPTKRASKRPTKKTTRRR